MTRRKVLICACPDLAMDGRELAARLQQATSCGDTNPVLVRILALNDFHGQLGDSDAMVNNQFRDQLSKTVIFAPMDGTISSLTSEIGERSKRNPRNPSRCAGSCSGRSRALGCSRPSRCCGAGGCGVLARDVA